MLTNDFRSRVLPPLVSDMADPSEFLLEVSVFVAAVMLPVSSVGWVRV